MVTSPGSIIVPRRIAKSTPRSGKRKYANANATIALEIVTSAAPRKLIQTLFQSQCATGKTLKRYCFAGCGRFGPVKFHDQWCGRNELSSTSWRVLNAAANSHSNG